MVNRVEIGILLKRKLLIMYCMKNEDRIDWEESLRDLFHIMTLSRGQVP